MADDTVDREERTVPAPGKRSSATGRNIKLVVITAAIAR
jgi:hypothetical protein